jgi:transcriptional regulator with PAS, ATPase and Fis domain
MKCKSLFISGETLRTVTEQYLWFAVCYYPRRTNMGDSPNKLTGISRVSGVVPDEALFGKSPAMAEVQVRAARISRTNVPILICGEGGTGKEALARWIHANSEYGAGELVKVNCAAIPGTLLESELFGYEKGAFTGANNVKPGRVEMAHRGTLFLDEIADLDLNL